MQRVIMVVGGLLFLYFIAKAIPRSAQNFRLRKQELELEDKKLEVEKLRMELEAQRLAMEADRRRYEAEREERRSKLAT